MLLSLWNYLRGYVVIEVTGFSVERFVNLAVHKGIYIWDVRYTASGVTMKVSARAFKLLRSCAEKTKCRMKIKEKIGYPFVAHRYRKRKFLVPGFVFFVAVLYFLSTFVWLVGVEGSDRIPAEDIISLCADEGLKAGTFKYGINPKELEKTLLQNFDDISWVNVRIKGTKATISLSEIIPKQPIIDRDSPCNIVAKKDGLIVSIVTSSGTPLVKQKDVVRKGDILVTGELIVKNDETGIIKEYVHAEADILAKLYREINFNVPYEYTEKKYTGRIKKTYGLLVFGKKFVLPDDKQPYLNYDKTVSRKQLSLGENYPLPAIILATEYKEFVPEIKTRPVDSAKLLAERMITGRIIREFDFESDVMDKNIEYTEETDCLRVKALITTYERIGEQLDLEQAGNEEETVLNGSTKA